MKNSILLLCLSVCLFSCGEDYGDSKDNFIKLPESIEFFSSEFRASSRIDFRNSQSETIQMNVSNSYRIATAVVDDKTKYYERNEVSLHYDESPYYPILLNCTALFKHGSDDVLPLLNTSYMHTDDKYGLIGSFNIGSGTIPSDMQFFEEITLNGKVFNKVYSVISKNTDAYSKFYYAQKEGVVGFSDEDNELWIYDKIVE